MRPPPPRSPTKVGLSRRELEWTARELVRDFPSDQQKLANAIVDTMITLITKNNAAVAQAIGAAKSDGEEAEG
jgi:hypothetical protein